MSLVFGKNSQVSFINESEMYKFIGYLAGHPVVIQWENNDEQGAWAKEGRMAFTTSDVRNHFPHLGYSAGVGNYVFRLNCNDFVELLFRLGFSQGNIQNAASIKNSIPVANYADFDAGYKL